MYISKDLKPGFSIVLFILPNYSLKNNKIVVCPLLSYQTPRADPQIPMLTGILQFRDRVGLRGTKNSSVEFYP
jgi:hypothetical protein